MTNTWQILVWKDEAGREDQMVGPKSALKDKVAELKKAGIEYKLSDFEMEVKKIGADTLEVRGEDDGRKHTD